MIYHHLLIEIDSHPQLKLKFNWINVFKTEIDGYCIKHIIVLNVMLLHAGWGPKETWSNPQKKPPAFKGKITTAIISLCTGGIIESLRDGRKPVWRAMADEWLDQEEVEEGERLRWPTIIVAGFNTCAHDVATDCQPTWSSKQPNLP